MKKPVTVESNGDVMVVTFDHPPVNLWDAALAESLSEALDEVEAGSPRAVLFRSEGRVVSGGVDVEEFARAETVERAKDLFDDLLAYPQRIEALGCPTIWSSHALTLTWAMELALACDLIIAADDCWFGLVEARIGLTPTMGGTQRLAARAGDGRAREFVMLGEPVPATTLYEWGVINRLVPAEEVDAYSRDFAAQIASGPTKAHLATKAIVKAARDGGVASADAMTVGVAAELFGTEDLQGGVRSFLTEGFGKAKFNGR